MMHRNLQLLFRREWPHLVLAARGTVAAIAALAVAVLLKLECPYWAAMTALIVIQPTRGLLLEKSFYRLIGTAAGSVAGMMMLLSSRSPAMLTILLALWLGACVGAGNLQYGLRSYGAMVAACTGAVIAMAGYNNPPHLHDLVFGRIACIVIGIVISTTVTLLFSHGRSKRELLDRLRRVTIQNIEWVALLVRGGNDKELIALRQELLVEIADIEGTVDAAWAGSLDLKRRKRHIRDLIVSLLTLLEAGKLAGDHLVRQDSRLAPWRGSLARHLEDVALHLAEQGSTRPDITEMRLVLSETSIRAPLLGETLGELINALQLVMDEWDTTTPQIERPASTRFVRHRDWQEAGRAAIRAAAAISAVGIVWHMTGWDGAPLMMMATSIMVSIFSTHDRPSVMLSHIFRGASLGVAAAFLCRLFLLPGTSNTLTQAVIIVPFLMVGIVALSHRRTALGAMDYLLFFLFVMQPGLPAVPPPSSFVAGGFACLGGIAVAILAFRFLLPIDPARRLRSIMIAIVHDLNSMAAADSLLLVEKCRARTHHRVLRMLANARKLDEDLNPIVEGGLATLAIGRYLQRLREAERADGIPPEALGAIRESMLKLIAAIPQTREILSILEDVSTTLSRAVEANHANYDSSVQAALLHIRDEQPPAQLPFVTRKNCQCHT
ncbi:FUSC family protein [Pelotalea chapellei]|uniref:FUSC family protein n=1 Tax=Pelotalea chapellei TaxID=44671 RepID=A0ABS5U6J7_9BACT|nr:FUSC family protein [Pelotalea chapellei]MBT1071283.1 FUSC family protein [Pelotalea chapellei]